jgi:hypothetical protein
VSRDTGPTRNWRTPVFWYGFNWLLESQSRDVQLSKPLKTLIHQQELNLGIAVAVYAILWGTSQKADLAPVLIYSFVLGNFVFAFQKLVAPLVNRARFPLSLLFCLFLIYAAIPIAVALATALVVVVTQHSVPFLAYLRSGWKFPTVVTLIATVYTIYVYLTSRLEQRNLDLELARISQEALLRTVASERDFALTELERAREVQQGLLPRRLPTVPGFQIASHFEPARVVGGDYFDIIKLSDRKLGVCIADVAGKGIAAALLMANVQATVRAFASDVASPAWVCSPGPLIPLSTLRLAPRGARRKTQGQDGVAFSFVVGLFHSQQHAGFIPALDGWPTNCSEQAHIGAMRVLRQRDPLNIWIAVVRPESAKLTPADSASIPWSTPLYAMIEIPKKLAIFL